jgi:hypothetical protein
MCLSCIAQYPTIGVSSLTLKRSSRTSERPLAKIMQTEESVKSELEQSELTHVTRMWHTVSRENNVLSQNYKHLQAVVDKLRAKLAL